MRGNWRKQYSIRKNKQTNIHLTKVMEQRRKCKKNTYGLKVHYRNYSQSRHLKAAEKLVVAELTVKIKIMSYFKLEKNEKL